MPESKIKKFSQYVDRNAKMLEKQTGHSVRPMRQDGFVNLLTNYGTQRDSSEHYIYQSEAPVNDDELERFYEGNGLFARIIDLPAEEAVKQFLVMAGARFADRAAGHVAHRIESVVLQLFGDAAAHAPEVRQRAVIPQRAAIAHLVELGDAHAVGVRLHALGHHVHRDLRQIQVRPDADRGRDARGLEHVAHDEHRKFPRRDAARADIVRRVEKDLVDGVDVDVLRRGIFEVDLIDARAVFHVVGHARRRHDIVQRERGISFQLAREVRAAGKDPPRRPAPERGCGAPR